MVVEWVLCDIKMTPPTSTEAQYLGSTGCNACLFYCYLQALGQQRGRRPVGLPEGEEACWSSRGGGGLLVFQRGRRPVGLPEGGGGLLVFQRGRRPVGLYLSSLLADQRCLLQIRFIAQWRTNQGHIMFFHVRIIHAHQKHPVCHTA